VTISSSQVAETAPAPQLGTIAWVTLDGNSWLLAEYMDEAWSAGPNWVHLSPLGCARTLAITDWRPVFPPDTVIPPAGGTRAEDPMDRAAFRVVPAHLAEFTTDTHAVPLSDAKHLRDHAVTELTSLAWAAVLADGIDAKYAALDALGAYLEDRYSTPEADAEEMLSAEADDTRP
jgi:hypothetical protein